MDTSVILGVISLVFAFLIFWRRADAGLLIAIWLILFGLITIFSGSGGHLNFGGHH